MEGPRGPPPTPRSPLCKVGRVYPPHLDTRMEGERVGEKGGLGRAMRAGAEQESRREPDLGNCSPTSSGLVTYMRAHPMKLPLRPNSNPTSYSEAPPLPSGLLVTALGAPPHLEDCWFSPATGLNPKAGATSRPPQLLIPERERPHPQPGTGGLPRFSPLPPNTSSPVSPLGHRSPP